MKQELKKRNGTQKVVLGWLFRRFAILSTCHFVSLPFCQLAILSTCHFVNLPFCQLAILWTCHIFNLSIETDGTNVEETS
jgi:hypothetical protein